MRQLHTLFNSAKTWHVIACWFLCFPPNLPELNLKLFWTSEQNNFRFSSGKFGGKHRNQQTITCQVLAQLNKIWSCLIFIKLYIKSILFVKKIANLNAYLSGFEVTVLFITRESFSLLITQCPAVQLSWNYYYLIQNLCFGDKMKNLWTV